MKIALIKLIIMLKHLKMLITIRAKIKIKENILFIIVIIIIFFFVHISKLSAYL